MKIILFLFIITLAMPLFAQQNIADAKLYREGETVTVSGIVTNGNELGPVRYIQDKTAGLAIYDTKLTDVKRGDSITVTGEVHPYNNLFEITKVSNLTVHSSENTLPKPAILSIDGIGEQYEGQLIQINNVEIVGVSGTFAGNKNYEFSKGGKSGILRINTSSPIVGQVIPGDAFNLIAICSQFSYNTNDIQTGYQLLPRDINDFISANSINFTSSLEIKNIATDGFTLTWKTDVDATTEVKFGNTLNSTYWTNLVTGTSTQINDEFVHEVNIMGRTASEIIYAQAFSVLESDTAFSSVGVFATSSNSTGKINVYFNTAVDQSVSTGSLAQNIDNAMEDTVIAYINRAEETIDFCIYNFNNSGLSNMSEALNNAKNRGVKIRFITSGNTEHSGVEDLDPSIQVLESPYSSTSGIMHNKFIVFDANSSNPEKPWIWTGSTNLTEDQVNLDANNMLFIQDQTLAKTYQIEFEEMWGSTGLIPNNNNAKFGAEKTDNTPHQFLIGGKNIQCYFSPSDGTNQQIINAINSADNDLEIETMLITRTDLVNAIIDAKQRNVEVQIITDNRADNSLAINDMLTATLPDEKFIFDIWETGMLHHKLAIVDANFTSSDPQVITGSHNWSFSADNINDENTLIIHDAEIANLYFQQFASRFTGNHGVLYVSAGKIELNEVRVFPNPTSEKITISSVKPISRIQIYSAMGVKTDEIKLGNSYVHNLNIADKTPGIYIVKIEFEKGKINSYKIVKK